MPKFIFALLITLFYLPAEALTLSTQSGMREPVSLSGHLTALRDINGQMRIQDVVGARKAGEFMPLPGFLGAGYTSDVYWLQFELHRTSETSDQWFVEVSPPYLNEVTLFIPSDNGGFTETRLGDLQPFAARPVPHRSFVFPIHLPEDQHVTFYLRVKTRSAMLVQVVAWQYPGLLAAVQTDTSLYSAYFGLITLGFLSNLVFWFWLRERVYLSYFSYLGALAIVMMASGGFVSQWIFPHFPLAANRMLGVSICIAYLLGAKFFFEVLRLRDHFPKLKLFFKAVLFLYGGCALVAIAGYYGVIIATLNLVMLIVTTGVAVAGPWLFLRGHRDYFFYTLAFTASFSGLILTIAKLMGWFSISAPTDYIGMLTTSIHVVLINVAVAERVRRSDREKISAEKQTAILTAEHSAIHQQRQFISMVSHEFRTPLAVIDATAQSIGAACSRISNKELYDQVSKRQDKIRRAVKHMASLLDNVLTSERLDFQEARIKFEAVSLRDLASATEKSWGHLLHAPDQFTIELANESGVVLVDRAMIGLVLSNLIDNAIKYSPPGSPITMRIGEEKGNGWIEVEDCGVGILPEEIENIFQKFYRGADVLSVPGAGLGLNIVRTLAQLHGGEVEVSSVPGTGSRFRLWLKLV